MNHFGEAYYYFEYDKPGRKKPKRTSWRMTIEFAARMHPGYRPILETVEYRSAVAVTDFNPYPVPGTGPLHWFKKQE